MPSPAKKPAAKRDAKAAAPKSKAVGKEVRPGSADAPVRSGSTPQVPRGMKDILPQEQRYWRHIYKKIESLARGYGYERIDTPILEETSLFVRAAGKQSDIVEKEMFSFIDKGGDNVSLRPEGTAPVARAYINHGMLAMPQPVKLYYVGPMFRYERPQHGRYRQHHQFGFEVFGDSNPVIDAELIMLAHQFYKDLGIKTTVHINSLGCPNCRPNFTAEIVAYFRSKRSQLCEDCKRRMTKNPLRVLDCKVPGCVALKEAAPHIVDHLDDDCKNKLMRVLEFLDDLQVPYVLDPHLVRGFDYYTRTVFEVVLSDEQVIPAPLPVPAAPAHGHRGHQAVPEAQPVQEVPQPMPAVALGGGGRYDNLIEQMGGRPTPACGFGIGLERAILQMKALQIDPPDDNRTEVFLAQLGDQARRKVFALFDELRAADVRVAANLSKNALKGQLEAANKMGAKLTAIIGQKEVLDGTVLLRDMESGMQEIVDYNKAVLEITKKLGRE